jgi:hypothetical protein
LGEIAGFDLSAFNVLAPLGSSHLRVAKLGATAGSVPLSALGKDFQSAAPYGPDQETLTLQSNGGRITGVAQWLRIIFFDDLIFENDPWAEAPSHWGSPVTPFIQPLDSKPGDPVPILVRRLDRQLLISRAET